MSQYNNKYDDDPNPVLLTKLLTFDHLDQSYLHDTEVFLKMRARAGRWTWCCLYGSDSVKCMRTVRQDQLLDMIFFFKKQLE